MCWWDSNRPEESVSSEVPTTYWTSPAAETLGAVSNSTPRQRAVGMHLMVREAAMPT